MTGATGNIRHRASVKTAALKEELLRRLSEPGLVAGMRFYTTNELVDLFHVSYVTAHRVLSEIEKSGYIQRDNGSGTFIRCRYPGKLTRIGIVRRLTTNPSTAIFYRELKCQAEDRGIEVIESEIDPGRVKELNFYRELVARGVHSLIRFPHSPFREAEFKSVLEELGMRSVFINDWWQDGCGFPTVRMDETKALWSLLDHLADCGHRQVILRQEDFSDTRHHLTGEFLKWHWQHELPLFSESVLHIGFEHMSQNFFRRLCRKGFTAILCSYAVDAMRLLRLEEFQAFRGRLALAALEDYPEAEAAGLTVYRQNERALAAAALDILCRAPSDSPEVIDIPGQLVVRNSSMKIER